MDELNESMFRAYDIRTPSALLTNDLAARLARAEAAYFRDALGAQIERWRRRGDWQKISVTELLFLRGWPNKEVAARLNVSEQAVANHKFELLAKLRATVRKLELPHEVFPELYEDA